MISSSLHDESNDVITHQVATGSPLDPVTALASSISSRYVLGVGVGEGVAVEDTVGVAAGVGDAVGVGVGDAVGVGTSASEHAT